jgi:hypothetical protein
MFDRVIMIDWSARNKPSPRRPSKDAIWAACGTLSERPDPVYFRTRQECMDRLRVELARERGRVLVGFDFPFGYPAYRGRTTMPAGRALCEKLARLIIDDDRNRSNRFEAAGTLNREIVERFGGDGPFWGRPLQREITSVSFTKPRACEVDEFRVVEKFQRSAAGASPKSVWQLMGAGSVGSQTLLGLAAIGRLLREDAIGERVRLWPFETGWGEAMCSTLADDAVVLAEIYPSLYNERAALVSHDVHDARQVIACRDAVLEAREDTLASMLSAPESLDGASLRDARETEGWILGVR